MIDMTLIWQSIPCLLQGSLITLKITSIAAWIGITLGLILAVLDLNFSKIIRLLVRTYITFVRGTPMLVQILFLFYILPQFGIMISPFWAASLAIGINSSAYISQMIKSGIRAVSKGQIEAAYALGFSRIAAMRYIILPQAFRITLPSLGNELITLIKDSSLASIIGVMELTKEASVIRSRTYDAFSILLVVSCIYLFLTTILSLTINYFERKYV